MKRCCALISAKLVSPKSLPLSVSCSLPQRSATLQCLLLSRAHLDNFMNDTLPTELWLYVCDFLRPADRLAVSQTCRAWRDTALKTRSLWADVEFVATSRYDGCPLGQYRANAYTTLSKIAHLRELLRRSAELPLTLSLHIHFGAEGVLPALVDTLAPHAERLVALHYRGRTHHVSSFLDRLPCLPRLRSLTTEGGVMQAEFHHFIGDAVQLPSLNQLHLSEKLLLPLTSVAFPTLHTLSMTIPRMDYIYHIISACPNLRTLRLNLRYVGEDECKVVPGGLLDVLRPVRNIRFSGLTRGRLRHVLTGISVTDVGDIIGASLCNATLTVSSNGSPEQSRVVTLTTLGRVWSATLTR